MFEEILEDIAQRNSLREVNTSLKLAVGLGGLVLCLVSTGYVAPLFIALALIAALVLLARIDAYTVAELFVAPAIFAATGVIVIVLTSGGVDPFWVWQPLSWLSLSVTPESIDRGFLVFCRTLGGMASLIFIALTTPMTDLFGVMRQCRLPAVLVELVMIIYQTIFLLLDHLVLIYRAQLMRLGYSSPGEWIRSFSTLAGAGFIGAWNAGEDLIRAREMRCYDGKLVILGEVRPVAARPLLTATGFLALSAALVVLTRSITVFPTVP
ncbi:MAG: cobalt ECF transporter T component CbiQ [Methanospirillum sp.]|nr:cobalt ECF transporter T component CbiQ [Methanospirillum sp.]